MAAGNMPKNPSNTEGVEPNDTNKRFIMTGDETDAGFESYKIAPSEDMTLWQNSEKWPQPKWLSQTRGQQFLPFQIHGFEHGSNRNWVFASSTESA
jgi:hypothetical protein